MKYPYYLEELIEYYQKLPGVGSKSAERMAFATIELTKEEIDAYSKALINAKNKIKRCKVCGYLTEKDLCEVCEDKTRNSNVICIVEDYKSVFSFEKTGKYQGKYHVLNGLISPMDDIGPEDINLSSLVERVNNLINPELIIALKPTIEGEATTLYIKSLLSNKNVTISRLSNGIPIGANIDYLDNLTLEKALEDRKII